MNTDRLHAGTSRQMHESAVATHFAATLAAFMACHR
jgi:hypothetical protein